MGATTEKRNRSVGTATAAELQEAMRHPLRAEMLVLLSERVASARGLESALEERHGEVAYETISYHLRKLQALNCIELVHVARDRGNEKFYRATVRAVFDTSDMEALSDFSSESKLVSYLQMIVQDIRESVEAGHFQSYPDTTVVRTLHRLDAAGLHRIGELMLDFDESLREVAVESSERLRDAGEEGLSVETGLLSFVRPSNQNS